MTDGTLSCEIERYDGILNKSDKRLLMYLPYAIIIHMDQHNSIYVYHPGQFSKIAIQGDRTLL